MLRKTDQITPNLTRAVSDWSWLSGCLAFMIFGGVMALDIMNFQYSCQHNSAYTRAVNFTKRLHEVPKTKLPC